MAKNHGFFYFPLDIANIVAEGQIPTDIFVATFDYNDAYFMLLQLP